MTAGAIRLQRVVRRPFAPPWLGALCSAGLVVVAGRPWGVGALAWLAFVPLFAALRQCRSWLVAGGLSTVTALGVASVAYEPAAALGPAWHLVALLSCAAPFAVAGASGWAVGRRLPASLGPVTVALFWAVAELLPAQPTLLGRFALPLSTFGYSQADLPALHLARLSSVTTTSLAVLLGNAFVLRAVIGWRSGRLGGALPALLGLASIAAVTAAAWLTAPASSTTTGFDVAVAQPNQPTALLAASQRVPAARTQVLGRLTGLAAGTLAADQAPPDLLLFPEGAWPQPLDNTEPLAALDAESVAALAKLPRSLIGAAGRTGDGGSTNSAFLWADGALSHFYDKVHLVPVTESGLQPGVAIPVTELATADRASMAVAPFICYDIVFPGAVRAAALAGAQLLAVLTDDAFAARGDVPHQHLRLARFRAVESGLPVAFASNTGPSALFDGRGGLLAASAAGQSALLRARLGAGAGPTPYIRYGNWVGALTCLAVVVLTLLAAHGVAGTKGGASSSQPSP